MIHRKGQLWCGDCYQGAIDLTFKRALTLGLIGVGILVGTFLFLLALSVLIR